MVSLIFLFVIFFFAWKIMKSIFSIRIFMLIAKVALIGIALIYLARIALAFFILNRI